MDNTTQQQPRGNDIFLEALKEKLLASTTVFEAREHGLTLYHLLKRTAAPKPSR